ncbi:MAG: DUF4124 domain-containing protein [Burkholderiales bacterium]
MKYGPALLAIFACIALPAGATDTVYKSVMPDGSIVYGNGPVKGATKVEPITVQPVIATDSPPAPPSPEAARRVREDLRADDAAWTKVSHELRSAEEALSAAKLAQQAGVEPLPGEMVGNAGGGVRPSEAYLARQQQLADDVRQAQARLDAALAARNALR